MDYFSVIKDRKKKELLCEARSLKVGSHASKRIMKVGCFLCSFKFVNALCCIGFMSSLQHRHRVLESFNKIILKCRFFSVCSSLDPIIKCGD